MPVGLQVIPLGQPQESNQYSNGSDGFAESDRVSLQLLHTDSLNVSLYDHWPLQDPWHAYLLNKNLRNALKKFPLLWKIPVDSKTNSSRNDVFDFIDLLLE